MDICKAGWQVPFYDLSFWLFSLILHLLNVSQSQQRENSTVVSGWLYWFFFFHLTLWDRVLIFQNPTASNCGRPQSPNNCSSTWTDCSHSPTDWQIFANNCHLIYNICVSLIIGARLNWLPTGCIVVIFLYNSNVAEHLWHFTVKSPSCMNYIRIEFFKADWIVSSCRLIADWISLVGVFLSP